MTHFYYDGRREFYTKDEVAVIRGHNSFREDVARHFNEFRDIYNGGNLSPEEALEQYDLDREEAEMTPVEKELGQLAYCYGIYRFDNLIASLNEYITLHKAFALMLEEYRDFIVRKKEKSDRVDPGLGLKSLTDEELAVVAPSGN